MKKASSSDILNVKNIIIQSAKQEVIKLRPDICVSSTQLLNDEENSICIHDCYLNSRLQHRKKNNNHHDAIALSKVGFKSVKRQGDH